MKIIDLLNKIANGEEVPKKIKYRGNIYNFKGFLYKLEPSCLYPHIVTDDYVLYCNKINNYILNNYRVSGNCLNDEVEILEEEKKIPEKLDQTLNFIDVEEKGYYRCIMENIFKINEIIDYLKIKGDE